MKILFTCLVLFGFLNTYSAYSEDHPRPLPFFIQLLPQQIYEHDPSLPRRWIFSMHLTPYDRSLRGGDLVIDYLGDFQVKYFYRHSDGRLEEMKTDIGAGNIWIDSTAYNHTALDCTDSGWVLLPQNPFPTALWVKLGKDVCNGPNYHLDSITAGSELMITQTRLITNIVTNETLNYRGEIKITKGMGQDLFFTIDSDLDEYKINIFELLDQDGHLILREKH